MFQKYKTNDALQPSHNSRINVSRTVNWG